MTALIMGTVALGISTWIAVRTTDYSNEKNYVMDEDSHTEGQSDRDPILDKYFQNFGNKLREFLPWIISAFFVPLPFYAPSIWIFAGAYIYTNYN